MCSRPVVTASTRLRVTTGVTSTSRTVSKEARPDGRQPPAWHEALDSRGGLGAGRAMPWIQRRKGRAASAGRSRRDGEAADEAARGAQERVAAGVGESRVHCSPALLAPGVAVELDRRTRRAVTELAASPN